MRKSEKLDELGAALARAQGEMEGARKDASNPFFKSKYANLESVVEASRPTLVKHGLAVIQTMGDGPMGPTLISTLLHSSGQWIEGEQPIMPKGGQNAAPQDLGSAITYARRYGYAAIVGVIQVDDDAEGAMGRGGNPAGKTQGNDGSQSPSVAAKTAASQQGIKDRLNGKQASIPTAGQGQARGPKAAEKTYDEQADEFFGDAGIPREGVGPVDPRSSGEGDRPGPQAGKSAGFLSKAAGARQGARPNEGGVGPRIRSGGVPGARPVGAAGTKGDKAAESSGGEPKVAGGSLVKPKGPQGNNGGAQNGGNGGQRGGIPEGAGIPAAQGSGGETGEPSGLKPVPSTLEEIDWFMKYMTSSFDEITTMPQLAELWTSNVNSVKALPDELRQQIIRAKDECKARVQK